MGWEGIKLENKQTELDCLIEFLTSNDSEYIAHSYNEEEGVYYFALKHKEVVTATVVSMNSFKGEREEGWIYFKVIHEFAVPLYINPSEEVFSKLTYVDDNFNYTWRNRVLESK